MATDLGLAREQTLFVVPETTRGTLVFPTDLTKHFVIGAGVAESNQQPTFTDSAEIRDTRDVINRFQDAKPAGTWKIPMYLRPSGTAGSPPMGAPLFKALCGTETINASTSVVYTQAKEKPSVSIWMKRGHTVFGLAGCAVTAAPISLTNKGAVMVEFSGGFMTRCMAGISPLATAITGAAITSVVVDNAKLFSVGARIYNKTKNYHNTNAGWTITAVNTGTNTLTVTPAINGSTNAWALDDEIAGYLPTGTAIGKPLESRSNTVTIGGVGVKLRSLNLNIQDNASYIEDEVGDDHPTDYVEDTRNITMSFSAYFRRDNAAYFRDGEAGTSKAVLITCGSVAGSKVEIRAPYTVLEVPAIGTNAPAIDMTIAAKALGSAGEDSLSITFK